MQSLAIALAAVVAGQVPGPTAPAPPAPIVAARASEAPRLDGTLDDPLWGRAEPFGEFVQLFPSEGARPSQRTEVRVLYDDSRLYVGVRCRDSEPGRILRPLGRRDAPPYSDSVTVIIDAAQGGRSAQSFSLNAAGVQQDGLYFDDDGFTADWDAVWDGRVALDDDGWSAQFAIPLSVLHLGASASQTWGFAVRREVGRSHELDATVLIPRNAKGVVSRLGRLVGLNELRTARTLELAPYLAARFSAHPQYLAETAPQPRLKDLAGDVGLDLLYPLAASLVLDAAVNPDFGQVEADQIIQNLTSYEVYFPEKRPFFNQGKDLFQSVGTAYEPSPQQLFYSRRIGLSTPILAAAKVTGRLSDTVQLGILDALVAGAGRPPRAREDQPDAVARFHAEQPLHLASTRSLPLAEPLAQNTLAGVVRWAPNTTTTLGAGLTSALPFGPRCTADEAALDTIPAGPGEPVLPQRCEIRSGTAAALDWNLRSRDSEWTLYGQVDASVSRGGPPERILPDGTALRSGDTGVGVYVTAGKRGGEPWRFTLHYEYESPRLDLNAVGYQRTQNEQAVRAQLVYTRPSGGGALHSWAVYLTGAMGFTTDGRGLNRGNQFLLSAQSQLKSFHLFACDAGLDDPRFDVREMTKQGVPYLRSAALLLQCGVMTNPARALAFDAEAGFARSFPIGPLAAAWRVGTTSTVIWRPHPRFEQRLTLQLERNAYQARWFDPGDNAPGTYSFGDLLAPVLSLTARAQLVLTPRLTVQLYLQFFTDYERYGKFYQATSKGAPIRPSDLRPGPTPTAAESPDLHTTGLNVNLVLRWEYRLGSALFLVYTRAQQELPWEYAGAEPAGFASLAPRALGAGPTTDTLLVKWSYWWTL